MASIRERSKKDGTTTYAVLYSIGVRQTSSPFPTKPEAEKFRILVNSVGGQRAQEVYKIGETVKAPPKGITLGEYLETYIDQLTGVEKRTPSEYRRYARRDLKSLAEVPLAVLAPADVARWLNALSGSAKTIANKKGFLAGALNKAVRDGKIASNPATGIRLPRSEQAEMTFLSKSDFRAIVNALPPQHRPLAEFLVASGCRFSEATALRPSDVNREAGTVRISRAWKQVPGHGYELGAPKTNKSRRTINVPKAVLDSLNYTGEYLFENHHGKPQHVHVWRVHVWHPAVARAKANAEIATKPRVHDLRHTCVSWLIAAGIPLPAIQRHLGHESIKTTVDKYGHLDRSAGEAVADAIAAAMA
jgi:integrase